jgi:formylglycine-generating enzyme required for sulfatase activity
VKEWEGTKRSSDLLLRGLPLTEAVDWFKKKPDDLLPVEREFVTASIHRKARNRMAAATIAGLVLMVIGGTIWLWGYSLEQASLKVRSLFMSIHLEPEMVTVPAGEFQQGDTQELHMVTIKPLAIGKFEVTFDEYERFAITTGRRVPEDQGWGMGRRPVINVSWQDAKDYAGWLSRETRKRYRLPTESEWEYAARSKGKYDIFAGTSQEDQLKDYAVYNANRTEPVGGKKPNSLDLYDMTGNAWEWVEDCWHDNYKDAPTDGSAWLKAADGICNQRVARGGSYPNGPETLRVLSRRGLYADPRYSNIGFRLAQDIP